MQPRTFVEIESVIRQSWSLETCDPADVADWTPSNPARGQCGSTALTVQDLLGGDLLLAEVRRPDGSRQGYHYWNRLSGGVDVDLTAEQFSPEEVVQNPEVVHRPPGVPKRAAEQYLLLRSRVFGALES
jgi:hypothetical protein